MLNTINEKLHVVDRRVGDIVITRSIVGTQRNRSHSNSVVLGLQSKLTQRDIGATLNNLLGRRVTIVANSGKAGSANAD